MNESLKKLLQYHKTGTDYITKALKMDENNGKNIFSVFAQIPLSTVKKMEIN